MNHLAKSKKAQKKQAAKPTTKANVGAQARHVAPKKKGSEKVATEPAKAPTPPTREGSKSAKVLELLNRPGGSTLKELMEATGWQAHSVRGFLSGTLRKKMKLNVTSQKGSDGERQYTIES
jgi:Protein of unknown function (DUF3489)